MEIIKEIVGENGATLTGYIQGTSLEMPHLNARPAVLILPGGLYRFCSDKEAEPVALAYVHLGFNAFVLRYATSSKENDQEVFDKALSDASFALQYLRENAIKMHIDKKQVAVVGFSSGGTIAATLGVLKEEKPNALILGYAPLHQDINLKLGVHTPDIISKVNEQTPPAFLFASQDDEIVPASNTLALAEALANKKIPYEVHIFASGGHGFSLANETIVGTKGDANLRVGQWVEQSVCFLNEHWKAGTKNASHEVEYGLEMTLEQIMGNVRSAVIFEKYLPGMKKMIGGQPMAAALSLKKIAHYAKNIVSEEVLKKVEEELHALNKKNDAIREPQTAVYPGKMWLDTKGKRIEAHGGALFYENDTYYWYGENKEKTDGKNGIWTWGIKAYSSKDFYNWKDEGLIIPPVTDDIKSNLHPTKHVDRPRIIKCDATGKYVCWIKLSGEEACFVILQADKLLGPYQIVAENYYPLGSKVGDFDLIRDEESGKAYLYMDADHTAIICYELSANYLEVQKEVSRQYSGLNAPFCREAPALFERNGKKYMLTSGMSGYIPNQSDSAMAPTWTSVFKSTGDPHVDDASRASFNSQISKVFQVPGKKDLYVAIADRWVPEYMVDAKRADLIMRGIATHYEPEKYQISKEEQVELMNSPMLDSANTSIADYVWLPLRFVGDEVKIEWLDSWRLEDYE